MLRAVDRNIETELENQEFHHNEYQIILVEAAEKRTAMAAKHLKPQPKMEKRAQASAISLRESLFSLHRKIEALGGAGQ